MKKQNGPRILLIDIETSPLIAYVWGLGDQNITLPQVVKDWNILSYAAKFVGEKKMFYGDLRNEKDKSNDKKLLQQIWKLMDEADIVLGQNSQNFDVKKIKARFLIHGMQPPSNFRQMDTVKISRKHFGFTSNKLEYLSKTLCTKHKKLSHSKFAGLEMWKQCLAGNKDAWKEMERYNKMDVLATEELYTKLQPYDNSINFNVYHDDFVNKCNCGGNDFIKRGYNFSTVGKFQRYQCRECGACFSSKENLLAKEKRKSLLKGV